MKGDLRRVLRGWVRATFGPRSLPTTDRLLPDESYFPPSLPPITLTRAFRASNGELGVMPSDAVAFLDAYEGDQTPLLGWELWLADHAWDDKSNAPRQVVGHWSGSCRSEVKFIPGPSMGQATYILGITRRQITNLDLEEMIDHPWLEHVRINFCL